MVEVAIIHVSAVDCVAWEVGVVVPEVLRGVAHDAGEAAHHVLHEDAGVARALVRLRWHAVAEGKGIVDFVCRPRHESVADAVDALVAEERILCCRADGGNVGLKVGGAAFGKQGLRCAVEGAGLAFVTGKGRTQLRRTPQMQGDRACGRAGGNQH